MPQQTLYQTQVKTSFRGFDQLAQAMKEGLYDTSLNADNEYSKAWNKCAEIYRLYLRKRFERSGNGEWPAISERTKQWRRRKHGIEHDKILQVTRTLIKALTTKYSALPGQYQRRLQYGIVVGYGGPAIHPDTDGRLTVVRLAHYHATGQGRNNKVREIIVPRDTDTEKKMYNAMNTAHRRETKKANNAV